MEENPYQSPESLKQARLTRDRDADVALRVMGRRGLLVAALGLALAFAYASVKPPTLKGQSQPLGQKILAVAIATVVFSGVLIWLAALVRSIWRRMRT